MLEKILEAYKKKDIILKQLHDMPFELALAVLATVIDKYSIKQNRKPSETWEAMYDVSKAIHEIRGDE